MRDEGLVLPRPALAAIETQPALAGRALHLDTQRARFNLDDGSAGRRSKSDALPCGTAIARVDQRAVTASCPDLSAAGSEGRKIDAAIGIGFRPCAGLAKFE